MERKFTRLGLLPYGATGAVPTCWPAIRFVGRRGISEEWSPNELYEGGYSQMSTFCHCPSIFHPTPRVWCELSQRIHTGHDHGKPALLCSTASKAPGFIKINVIHFPASIQRGRANYVCTESNPIHEQHTERKVGLCFHQPSFTLPLHPQTFLRLFGTLIHLQNAGE